jgi:hypothetical protein
MMDAVGQLGRAWFDGLGSTDLLVVGAETIHMRFVTREGEADGGRFRVTCFDGPGLTDGRGLTILACLEVQEGEADESCFRACWSLRVCTSNIL